MKWSIRHIIALLTVLFCLIGLVATNQSNYVFGGSETAKFVVKDSSFAVVDNDIYLFAFEQAQGVEQLFLELRVLYSKLTKKNFETFFDVVVSETTASSLTSPIQQILNHEKIKIESVRRAYHHLMPGFSRMYLPFRLW